MWTEGEPGRCCEFQKVNRRAAGVSSLLGFEPRVNVSLRFVEKSAFYYPLVQNFITHWCRIMSSQCQAVHRKSYVHLHGKELGPLQ